MKKVVFILVLILLTGSMSFVNAQDVIIKADGSEIRAKINEVGPNDSYFKYKLYNQGVLSEQSYDLKKHEVFKIVYANGDVWVNPDAGKEEKKPVSPASTQSTQPFQSQYQPQTGQTGGYTPPSPISYKKGYIGAGIGLPTTIKNYEDIEGKVEYGINAGYLFNQNCGIAASFMVASFDVSVSDASVKLVTNTGLVGPIFSIPFSNNKLEYDIRPYIGFISGKLAVDELNMDFKADKTVIAYGSGMSLRWNVHSLISLSLNIDAVYHGKGLEFEEIELKTEKLSTLSMGVGVNFRF